MHRVALATRGRQRIAPLTPPRSLAALLAVVAIVGVGWALIVPPWQSPDTVAHFAYAQSLAAGLPLPGDKHRPGVSSDQLPPTARSAPAEARSTRRHHPRTGAVRTTTPTCDASTAPTRRPVQRRRPEPGQRQPAAVLPVRRRRLPDRRWGHRIRAAVRDPVVGRAAVAGDDRRRVAAGGRDVRPATDAAAGVCRGRGAAADDDVHLDQRQPGRAGDHHAGRSRCGSAHA